jgi:hypothetical protein
MGVNGRSYVDNHFTKSRVLRAYDEYFGSNLKPRAITQSNAKNTLITAPKQPEANSGNVSSPS